MSKTLVPNPFNEIAHWREAINQWSQTCHCNCDGCSALVEAIAQAIRVYPEQYEAETPARYTCAVCELGFNVEHNPTICARRAAEKRRQ